MWKRLYKRCRWKRSMDVFKNLKQFDTVKRRICTSERKSSLLLAWLEARGWICAPFLIDLMQYFTSWNTRNHQPTISRDQPGISSSWWRQMVSGERHPTIGCLQKWLRRRNFNPTMILIIIFILEQFFTWGSMYFVVTCVSPKITHSNMMIASSRTRRTTRVINFQSGKSCIISENDFIIRKRSQKNKKQNKKKRVWGGAGWYKWKRLYGYFQPPLNTKLISSLLLL